MRTVIRGELARRQSRNARYSLRAFARYLGTHHSTLSQILEGRRRLTPRGIRALGSRLGLSAMEMAGACVAENAAVILRLAASPGFRANSRWLAERSGLPVDDVNVALYHLLHLRRIRMTTPSAWTRQPAS